MNLHRVVELVCVVQDPGGLEGVVRDAPQVPLLLEPGEVPDLPQRRVHDAQLRPDHLLVVQVLDELQRALAGVLHHADELVD
jgi:hypothetical protein